jgi:4-hydroxy-tetrahydrodipicolinate synthase
MITGSMVAIVTPFKDGKIDEKAFRNLIERQIQNGTSCIVPCGTTGESATLTHEEHNEVIRIAVSQSKGRVKIMAGAGSNATHEAIFLHQAALNLGADAALHITPYYNKPTQEGLYQHFKAIAQSNNLPIYLYNVPGRTAVNMLPETVARLSQIKNIVGIKEACGNLDQIQKVIDLCPKDFIVLSGEDSQTLDIYKMGGRGAISVTANVLPKDCADEWQAFSSGDLSQAQVIHDRLMPLHDVLFIETNPIPVKAALASMELITEEYRLPLVALAEGNKTKLLNILKEQNLL